MSRVEDELDALITDSGYDRNPQSRVEAILDATINETEYTDAPQSVIEEKLLELKAKIEEGGGTVPTSNLWGGLQMAIDLIKAGLSSAGAADDYVSLTGSYTMSNRVAVNSIFESNKRYTFILAFENNSTYSGGSVTANVLFRYSDDTYDTLTITGSQANTKYTHAFVSAEGKTVVSH